MGARFARARWLAYSHLPGVLVLRYHRVAEVESDPNALAVSPRLFAAQMEVVRRRFRPVPLAALEAGRGSFPVRGIAVTFDDGYADNLLEAAPVLEQCDIPATVFVTTGLLGQTGEFWWDTLDRILLRPGELPSRLRLATAAGTVEFDLGPDARYPDFVYRSHLAWTLRETGHPTRRHELFRLLSERLRPMTDENRRAAIAELGGWSGVEGARGQGARTLSREEVARLGAGGLIEIGSHSVTHSMLSRLDEGARWREIHDSRTELEHVTKRPVTAFAYPYGAAGRSEEMVRKAGYRVACGTRGGVVFGRGRRYRLPRVRADNWDAGEFEARLAALG